MAVGILTTLTGCSIEENNSSSSINDFRNPDGSVSLYDNKRFNPDRIFHEQALTVSPYSTETSLDGNTISAGFEVTLLTGGWETEHIDASLLDVGKVAFGTEIKPTQVDVSAIASLYSPSISINIEPITIDFSAHIGAIGGTFHAGTGKFEVQGAYIVGGGISIQWE